MLGNFARDFGAAFGRVKALRVSPDEFKPLPDFFIAQLVKPDAKRERVGKRLIGAAGAGKIGADFDDVANVHDQQERRRGFVRRQRADVIAGLDEGFEHRIVPAFRVAHGRGDFLALGSRANFFGGKFKAGLLDNFFLKFFGFEQKAGAFVEINAAIAG